MSEAAPEVTPEAEAAPAETTSTDSVSESSEQQTFDAEYVKKLRAEAAKYRTEAKELAGKARKFDDITESQKSELQKATERAAQAEKDLKDAQQSALRSRVAADKKLPPSVGDRLKGETKEEMEADADAMLAEINATYVAKQGASREETGAGVAGKSSIDTMTPEEMVAATRAHRGSSSSFRQGR